MSSSDSRPITVLHVDDEADFGELTKTFLERENEQLSVETAAGADEGLARLTENAIDCVVSDFQMPGRNGIEFLEAVREDDSDLPFILFTGKGSEEIASEAISASVSDYLQKAIGTDQYAVLANRIENLVAKHRAENLVERAFHAMDRSREGIALLDEDGEFIYVNRRYCDIVGYEQDELIGEFWELVYPEEQAQRIYDQILEVVPEEGHWTGDTVYQRKDGSRVLVGHALAYSDEGTMICLIRDLSDADAHPAAHLQERRQFELLVDAVEEYAICLLDPDGYVTSWNAGAERLVGYAEDEIVGDHVSRLLPEEGREAGLADELLDRAMEDGSVTHRGPVVREGGEAFDADVTITAVFDDEGRHQGFGMVTEELSEAGG